MATRQLVVFSINGEEFGIGIEQVNIIEKPLEIFKIPNTPDYIEGLVNLRGKVYTVFSLRKRFSMAAKELDENAKMIMVNAGSSIVGLIVDEVKEIIRIEDNDIENTPKALDDLQRKYVCGVAKSNGRIILMMDVETVITPD